MKKTKVKKEKAEKVTKVATFDDLRKTLRKEDFFRYQKLEIVGKMLAKKSRLGLSNKKLSKKTGIAEKTIAAIIDGNENPSFKTICRLAEGLDMELVVTDKK